MPFTILHAGPGILAKSVLGDNFHFKTFMAVNIMFDVEPAMRMFFDLPGELHETTHNPVFGLAYFFVMLVVATSCGIKFAPAMLSAAFGAISHLWLDAIYHVDVAAGMMKWGVSVPRYHDAEFVCLISAFFGLLLLGIRKSLRQRFPDGIGRLSRRFHGLFG